MNFGTSSQCYVCLIVGDDTCDDTYSARLYKAKEKKKIIFCMCLSQPDYIKVILQCNNKASHMHPVFVSLFRGVTLLLSQSTEFKKRRETLMFWMK